MQSGQVERADRHRIKVIARVRPLLPEEAEDQVPRVSTEIFSDRELAIIHDQNRVRFEIDHVYGPKTTNLALAPTIREVVDVAAAGMKATLIAHGQSSSGKSWTLFGPPTNFGSSDSPQHRTEGRRRESTESRQSKSESANSPTTRQTAAAAPPPGTPLSQSGAGDADSLGLVQRAFVRLFEAQDSKDKPRQDKKTAGAANSTVVAVAEVYNEKVYDLLSITEPCARIDILEQADERGNLFDTITEVPVSSAGEAILVVGRAQAARRARHAAIAALPARSHLLIQVIVEREKIEREKSGRDAIRMLLRGRLLIAGLGASQAWDVTQEPGSSPYEELTRLNVGLLNLRRCFHGAAFAQGEKQQVPSKDAKLTHALADSFGGAARTTFLCCVTPALQHAQESLATLKLAELVRQVQTYTKTTEVRLHEGRVGFNAPLRKRPTLQGKRGKKNYKRGDSLTSLMRRGRTSSDMQDTSDTGSEMGIVDLQSGRASLADTQRTQGSTPSERVKDHVGAAKPSDEQQAPNAATADNPKKPQPGAGVSSIQMKVTTAVGRKIEREAKQNAEQLNKLLARCRICTLPLPCIRHGDYVSLERELLDSQKNRQLEIKEEIKTSRSRNEVNPVVGAVWGEDTAMAKSKFQVLRKEDAPLTQIAAPMATEKPPAAPTAPAAPPLVAEARRPRDDPAVILEEYALLDLYKENREEERVAARERAAIAAREAKELEMKREEQRRSRDVLLKKKLVDYEKQMAEVLEVERLKNVEKERRKRAKDAKMQKYLTEQREKLVAWRQARASEEQEVIRQKMEAPEWTPIKPVQP